MPIPSATVRQIIMASALAGLVLAGGAPAQASEMAAAPCPVSGRATHEFGPSPAGFHHGLDIANTAGSPIKAGLAGTVTSTGSSGALGQYIVVTHPNSMKTTYAHLRRASVGVGASVNSATRIGEMGATGTGDGRARLHLEVRQGGERINPRLTYSCPR